MKQLIIIFLAACLAFGQAVDVREPGQYHNYIGIGKSPITSYGGNSLFSGAVAAYFPGPEVAVGHWATPGWQMLLWSGDMTQAAWGAKSGHTNLTATSFDLAIDGYFLQGVGAQIVGRKLIGSVTLSGSGNTALEVVSDPADRTCEVVTLSATPTRYSIAITIATTGNLLFGLENRNAICAGVTGADSITAVDWQLTPGSTVREYQATTTRQSIPNRVNPAAPAYRGTDGTVQTSDGTLPPGSRNLLAPGSAANLTNAAWGVAGSAVVNDFDTVTFAAAATSAVQQTMTLPIGTFVLSADLSVSTGSQQTRLGRYNATDGDAWSADLTLTTTPQRFSLSFTNTAVVTNYPRIANSSGGGVKTINATNFQLEQVSAGGVASPFTLPSNPIMMGWDADGVDDIITGAATLPGNWAFTATIRPDAVATRGLWQNGTGAQKVSLDANGKVAYTNGVDTVTSTAAIPVGLWSIISVVNNGNTITHYLNGAANGSAAASGASNAFTALRFGTDGTTFYDGQLAAFVAYNTAKTGPQELAKATRIAADMWNYRGFRTAITNVTAAPLHAWLAEVQEWLWAKLLPTPGGVQ